MRRRVRSLGYSLIAILSLLALIPSPHPAAAADVLTSHNDNARTGANLSETILTTRNVSPYTFGKLWTLHADGQIVAQPLYVSDLAIDTTGNVAGPHVRGTFNAVLIATMHNTVYLYDADTMKIGPDGRTVPLWARWLGQPRPGDARNLDMYRTNDPEWGILSTPVIDDQKTTVYLVAWHDDGGDENYRYRLHALRLNDGTPVLPPVELTASVPDSRGGSVSLDPVTQKQRAGLLLSRGLLYIAFGGDKRQGLLLAYDARTLRQTAAWATAPTGSEGGIWQAGQAPAADADGNVYLMTGNGTVDTDRGGSNYGQSFVKLRVANGAFIVDDSFTPCNAEQLNGTDDDLGSSGPLLIPGTDLITGGGKGGSLYLLFRNQMGGYQRGNAGCHNPNIPQEVKGTDGHAIAHHIHGSPVFWQGPDTSRIYVWPENDLLKAYVFEQRRYQRPTMPTLGSTVLPPGMPGGMLSLSSSGNTAGTGILWAVTTVDGDANRLRGVQGRLIAVDATDVSRTLWTSEQTGGRDRLGLFARFVPPTIAGGKVFVATYGDAEPKRAYDQAQGPTQFPARYYVAVYGPVTREEVPIVEQDRGDVTVLRAAAGASVAIDIARCVAQDGGLVDCTEELERLHRAPSLQQVLVPAGHAFAGCRLLRITTASNAAAVRDSLGIGFYSAVATEGERAPNRGRIVSKGGLKQIGSATLKSGQPAILHEFVGITNCALAPGMSFRTFFKPFIDFIGDGGVKIFRNWDVSGDYTIDRDTLAFDRQAEVLGN